jgi:hypothetical protein
MPLIYSFVARGTTVLADYTAYTGNFSVIAIQVCSKVIVTGFSRRSCMTRKPGERTVIDPNSHSSGVPLHAHTLTHSVSLFVCRHLKKDHKETMPNLPIPVTVTVRVFTPHSRPPQTLFESL